MRTSTVLGDTRSRSEIWLDKLEIQELIHGYADGVNRGDWDQVEAAYVPDAVWESPLFGLRFESARAFRDHLAMSMHTADILVQTPHCTSIRFVDVDTATATTTIHEFSPGLTGSTAPSARLAIPTTSRTTGSTTTTWPASTGVGCSPTVSSSRCTWGMER